MTVVLRWKANSWEKAPLPCRLFGHIWESGWWGSLPYFEKVPRGQDGIGRHHIALYRECNRCGIRSQIGYVHGDE